MSLSVRIAVAIIIWIIYAYIAYRIWQLFTVGQYFENAPFYLSVIVALIPFILLIIFVSISRRLFKTQ